MALSGHCTATGLRIRTDRERDPLDKVVQATMQQGLYNVIVVRMPDTDQQAVVRECKPPSGPDPLTTPA